MDYKEKYKEALDRMKSWVKGEHPECFCEAQKAAEFIFPELKESEDEQMIERLKSCVYASDITPEGREEIFAWLEKQGDINETSAEWSEEDKQMILSIEQVMNCASVLNLVPEKIDNIKSWLKSLRPQKQWKPSTAQLIVIKDLIEDKNTSKVNKVVLRGMLDEFKQYFGL